MFRALLKKQFLELNMMYFRNPKTGKMRSRGGIIGFIILFGFVFLTLASMFGSIGVALAAQFFDSGFAFPWLFFAVAGLISLALGVFGSVFNTYSALYMAKDNDTLLTMPIPPLMILVVRMISVFAMSLLYSGIAWIPMSIAGAVSAIVMGTFRVSYLVVPLIMFLFISLFVTVLTCALGYVVAAVAARIKKKSFVSVIVTLGLMAVYYVVYFKASEILQSIVANSEQVAKTMKTWFFPIYALAVGCTGNWPFAVLFVVFSVALFALCCLILSKTFIRLVTLNKGEKKAVYKEKTAKGNSLKTALLKRELRHFSSSAPYMLNCGLGVIILVALMVVAAIKGGSIVESIYADDVLSVILPNILPSVLTLGICFIIGMDMVTAPSISLEGKSLWLIQSLPVPTRMVLEAKENLHILINAFPAVVTALVIGLIFRFDPVSLIACCVAVFIYVWMSADIGLMMGILRADFNWSSEAIAVKQGTSVLFTMLIDWAIIFVVGGTVALGWFLPGFVPVMIQAAVFALAFALFHLWVVKRGPIKFETL